MKLFYGGVIGAILIGTLTVMGFIIGANKGTEIIVGDIDGTIWVSVLRFIIGGVIGGVIGGFIGYLAVRVIGGIVWGTIMGALVGYVIGYVIKYPTGGFAEGFVWGTVFAVVLGLIFTYFLRKGEVKKEVPERIA